MRRVMLSSLLLLLTSSPALAVFCARDVVPAATLLVPYVEVDMTGERARPGRQDHHPAGDQHGGGRGARAARDLDRRRRAGGEHPRGALRLRHVDGGLRGPAVGTWSRFDTSLRLEGSSQRRDGGTQAHTVRVGPRRALGAVGPAPRTPPVAARAWGAGEDQRPGGREHVGMPYGDVTGQYVRAAHRAACAGATVRAGALGVGNRYPTRHYQRLAGHAHCRPLSFSMPPCTWSGAAATSGRPMPGTPSRWRWAETSWWARSRSSTRRRRHAGAAAGGAPGDGAHHDPGRDGGPVRGVRAVTRTGGSPWRRRSLSPTRTRRPLSPRRSCSGSRSTSSTIRASPGTRTSGTVGRTCTTPGTRTST